MALSTGGSYGNHENSEEGHDDAQQLGHLAFGHALHVLAKLNDPLLHSATDIARLQHSDLFLRLIAALWVEFNECMCTVWAGRVGAVANLSACRDRRPRTTPFYKAMMDIHMGAEGVAARGHGRGNNCFYNYDKTIFLVEVNCGRYLLCSTPRALYFLLFHDDDDANNQNEAAISFAEEKTIHTSKSLLITPSNTSSAVTLGSILVLTSARARHLALLHFAPEI